MTIDHVIEIPFPALLGAIYGVSEVVLLVSRRSGKSRGESKDRGSLALLWIVIVASIYASMTMHRLTDLLPCQIGKHGA